MYEPHQFRVDDLDRQAELIETNALGTLITSGPGGLDANPIPFLLDRGSGTLGTLRCHLARANPQWQALQDGAECLVVFQDRNFYVTPAWYATKQETGKVVPTWNYMTVHAWGRPTVIHDEAWLHQQIRDLTHQHEAGLPEPWEVSDAPERYVAAQIKGIVGVEIRVSRSAGKWKMSQNRPLRDREGVRDGLTAAGSSLAGLIETD